MASNKMEKAANMMVFTNLTQREIAEELAVNESTLSRWKQTKEFQKFKEDSEKTFLGSLIPEAMQTLKGLLKADSESVRLNAATDILDRSGYKAMDKLEISGIQAEQSKLEDMIQQMRGGD